MLLREIKNIYHKELGQNYPVEEVDSFFYLLVEHYLGLERFVLALDPDLIISKEKEQPLFEALAELKLNRPVQYIMGKTRFMGMDFVVDDRVLIPRPETEDLVRWIIEEVVGRKGNLGDTKYGVQHRTVEIGGELLKDAPIGTDRFGENSGAGLRILDIGTGSGCIAVALAKNLPDSHVAALDISKNALETAKKNAELNEVAVTFMEMDILSPVPLAEKYDIIVSNPPYVRQSEKVAMHKNVTDFEPESALFVPDDDPLLFYRHIAEFAKGHLVEGGRLYIEINQFLAKETQQLLEEHNFEDIELRKDIFDNDRMLMGVLTPVLEN